MRLFKLRPMNQTHDDFDPNWKIYLSKHDQYECTNVDIISKSMPFSFERTLARLMAAPKDFFQKMGMLSPRSTKSAGKGQACLASANEAGVVIKWGAEKEPPTTTRSNVDASSESLEPSIVSMVDTFSEDAIVVMLSLGAFPVSGIRALACASRTMRQLIALAWRDAHLAIADADASWIDAKFVAGLSSLEKLCIGDHSFDLTAMRSQSHVDTAGWSATTALILGAVLGGDVDCFTLASGGKVDARRMRTCRKLKLDGDILAEADIALLCGVIWRNPRINRGVAMANLRKRSYPNSDDAKCADYKGHDLFRAEQEYMEWSRAWLELAHARRKTGGTT